MIPINDDPIRDVPEPAEGPDVQPTPVPSAKDRRLERNRKFRAANRERLREYGRLWKASNSDRVRIHREREYAERRRKRRRLKQRTEAQRRRRAQKRLMAKKWSL